jgi:hypothetical protein
MLSAVQSKYCIVATKTAMHDWLDPGCHNFLVYRLIGIPMELAIGNKSVITGMIGYKAQHNY